MLPMRVAVWAAAAPAAQRPMLKDALTRTLEANGLKVPARTINAVLGATQTDILAAIERGPAGQGEAAAILRALCVYAHMAPSSVRRVC